MKIWYDIKANKIIRVSVCQTERGGYTFYKTRYLGQQGTRVRMRPAKWFDNFADAETALNDYCRDKSQYKKLDYGEILKRLEALKPVKFNPLFGAYI